MSAIPFSVFARTSTGETRAADITSTRDEEISYKENVRIFAEHR
jgi:hypothetical protein